jgi:hypothetical protein
MMRRTAAALLLLAATPMAVDWKCGRCPNACTKTEAPFILWG